ncbi:MAG: hypothetical protein RBT61_00370 [Candidatus Kapabacteria bacterium]|jgi:hypothetical protein|nr:hypothetical protein [Candidatus Kapabacteria bacterium]
MRVSAAKTSPRVERNHYLNYIDIKAYGKGNDYPQKILDIVAGSGTGKSCFDLYVKFIIGGGFENGTEVINQKNERLNSLLSKCAKDLRAFGGFALLLKYNFKGTVNEIYNIPFEHCRLEVDKQSNFTGRVAVHPDWTKETGRAFRKSDIAFINGFSSDAVKDEISLAGGPTEYIGQVYYFTEDGDWEYPTCPFDAVVTDMLTEESVSTVKHRNAKHNFLPAGILIRKGIRPRTLDDGRPDPNDRYNEEMEQSANEIKRMQGDINASKIWVVDIDADEDKPEFVPFEGKNYDKQYELTEQTVQDNISRMFRIPPILRGVDVGAGFGAELIENAYNYMNSVVEGERNMIETAFVDVFENFVTSFTEFTISPLEYIAKTGNYESTGDEGRS